ncbi:unnamed protein product [Owenia fusiformis]|uniref:C2H2-type domain-containing protein n=1 Tax=Owenia fusiformis TaxID=6347 RepID=A0A8S4MWB7_OWEFU|nr:unnamed protein product [Owenia fusiformis]
MGELSQSCKRISLRIQLLFDDVQSLTDAEQEQIMEIIRVRLDEWQALKGLDYPTEKLSERADPNPTPPKMAKLTTNLQGRKENLLSQKPTPSISPTKPHTITTVASPTKAPQTLTSVTPRTVDMHNNLVEMDSEPVDHNNQISNELDINSFGRDTSNSQDTSTLIDAIKQEYEDDDNDETDDVNYDSNFTDISIKTESDINNSIDQVKEEQIEDDDCVPPESLKKPTGKSKRKMDLVIIQGVKRAAPRRHICEECGNLFNSKSALNTHCKEQHGQGVMCSFKGCEKVLASSSRLHRHERIHTRGERILCDACTKSFCSKATLLNHLKTCRGIPTSPGRFECPECKKRYIRKADKNRHIRVEHEGSYISCIIEGCIETFKWRKNFLQHMAKSHGINDN